MDLEARALNNQLVTGLAEGLAYVLARLNALLLFSSVVIALGSVVLVPVAALLRGLRR